MRPVGEVLGVLGQLVPVERLVPDRLERQVHDRHEHELREHADRRSEQVDRAEPQAVVASEVPGAAAARHQGHSSEEGGPHDRRAEEQHPDRDLVGVLAGVARQRRAPPPTTRCRPPTPAPRSTAPSARRSVDPRRARQRGAREWTRGAIVPRASLATRARPPRVRRRPAPGSGRRRGGCREAADGPGDRHRCQRHQPAPVGRRHGRGQRPGHDAGRRGRPGLRAAGGRIRHGRSVGQDGVQLGQSWPEACRWRRRGPRAGSRRARSARRAPSPGRRSPCRAATPNRCGS